MSPEEIEHFLGILFKMCFVQIPTYGMYGQSSTRYEKVANIMSRDRFELIKSQTLKIFQMPQTLRIFQIIKISSSR